jgi:Ni,Fe-hydrogenase maturation factor
LNVTAPAELTDRGWPQDGDRTLRSTGSHNWGVTQTLKLAKRLAIAPARVTLWGIEGQHFDPQHFLSAEIQEALPSIVGEILAELLLRALR